MFLIFMTEIISRTDEGQPRPKYIFNKMWSFNIYTFFNLQRFGPDHHHRILKFIILIFQNNNYKSVII